MKCLIVGILPCYMGLEKMIRKNKIKKLMPKTVETDVSLHSMKSIIRCLGGLMYNTSG